MVHFPYIGLGQYFLNFTEKKPHHLLCSITQLCPILCDPMDYSMPGFPVHHQLPELAQTHVHWVSDAIQPSYPLSSPSPSTFKLSQNQSLFNSFSFSISPSSEYSGLISFKIDWFNLLAIQGTLKSLLQHHDSKTSVPQHSAFFMVNSHIHTWLLEKTIALTRWTFVSNISAF